MSFGNLPIPIMQGFGFNDLLLDIRSQFRAPYEQILSSTTEWKNLLLEFQKDMRIQSLVGQLVSYGQGGFQFSIQDLALWFIWACNEFGKPEAEKYLNSYLDSEEITVIITLWLFGVEVEEPIKLIDGYEIQSIYTMPNSIEREYFLQLRARYKLDRSSIPQAAILKECKIKKILYPQTDGLNKSSYTSFSENVHAISLLMNLIPNATCIPYYFATYSRKDTPFGFFGSGYGGGIFMHDIFGLSHSKLNSFIIPEFNSIIASYLPLSSPQKNILKLILSRLGQAKRRDQIEDKILDLAISLEMVLLDDNNNKEQLSLSFRLRGSWLLAADQPIERKKIYSHLRDIYKFRSCVAHSGLIEDMEKLRNNFPEYVNIAERVIKHRILRGKQNWSDLILNIKKS